MIKLAFLSYFALIASYFSDNSIYIFQYSLIILSFFLQYFFLLPLSTINQLNCKIILCEP